MLKVYKGLVLSFLILGLHFFSFGSIIQSTSPTMVGCADTFTTNLAGTIYQWDFGPYSLSPVVIDTNNQSAIAFFYQPGTYEIYVNVITGGSSQLDSLSITVISSGQNITLSATTDTICEGGQITFTASTGFIRYDFLINDSLVSSTTADNYTTTSLVQGDSVRVLAFNGSCFTNPSPALHPVVFPIPVAATLTSSVDTICGGDTVIFTATPGYDTYKFYNGGSEQQSGPSNIWTTSQLPQGNHVSVVVSRNGCYSGYSNIDSVFVKTTPFVTTVIASQTVCAGDTVTITANPPGLDDYNFFINSVTIQDNNLNTYTSSTLVTNDTIKVIGTLQGCSSHVTYPIIMTVNQVPNVTLTSTSANDSTCQGIPVTFTASPSGYATYEFFDTTSLLQSTSSNTYTTSALVNGNSISVTAVNLGCTSPASDTIAIHVTPAPLVTVGLDQAACLNAPPDTLTGFSPAGGTWTGTGITDGNLGVFTPAVASPGSYELTYTYIDAPSGCPGFDSINFIVKPIPTIVLSHTINICENQSAQLNAVSNGVSYNWNPSTDLSNPNISNPVATPAQTTNYVVLVTGANSCFDTASVDVIVNPNPLAGFTVSNVCANAPVVFTNTSVPIAGSNFWWYFGDGALSTDVSPTHTYNNPDTFNVVLIAELGQCFDTITNPLVVFPSAIAGFDVSPLFGYNDNSSPISFIDQSLNTAGWFWDFGDLTSSTLESPTHVYTQTGVYTITLIASNQDGCNDTAIRTNYVTIYQTPQVYIHNVFAPNATDVDNSILLVHAKGVKVFEWDIYNRIGEKVFQSQDPNIGWTGNYKTGKAPEGVYSYYLRIVFEDDTVRYYKGSITLLR